MQREHRPERSGRRRAIARNRQSFGDEPIDREPGADPLPRCRRAREQSAAGGKVRTGADHAGRRLECSTLTPRTPGVPGRAQVRPDTRQVDAGRAPQPVDDPREDRRIEAAAAKPGLDLEVDLERRGERRMTGIRDRGERPRGERLVAERERDAGSGSVGRGIRRHRIQDQDRRADPAGPQLERLVERRHAESVGAGSLEGPSDRHGAVPVRIGLHDRIDPGPCRHERAERDEVVAQPIEVDRQPRRPRQPWQARIVQRHLDPPAIRRRSGHTPAAGSWRGSSRGPRPPVAR